MVTARFQVAGSHMVFVEDDTNGRGYSLGMASHRGLGKKGNTALSSRSPKRVQRAKS